MPEGLLSHLLLARGRKRGYQGRAVTLAGHVDLMPFGENPWALLTILYCSTDWRCRVGAPVYNVAHSASFHASADNARSNPRPNRARLRPARWLLHIDIAELLSALPFRVPKPYITKIGIRQI